MEQRLRARHNLTGQDKASLPQMRAACDEGASEHIFGGDRAAADAHDSICSSPFPTHASRRRECGAAPQQASDRAHRIGQERPVTVYRLVTAGTIEERIVELHHRKRELANSLLEGTESAGKISQEELIGLLSG